MKPVVRLLGMLIGLGLISANQSPKPNYPSTCPEVREAVDVSRQIKAGVTRAEVEKVFTLDGGLQFPSKSRYLYQKCHFIKIDVEYARKTQKDSSDDIVRTVSKLYLEYPAEN